MLTPIDTEEIEARMLVKSIAEEIDGGNYLRLYLADATEVVESFAPPTTNMPAWLALWWMQEKGKVVVDVRDGEWQWNPRHSEPQRVYPNTGGNFWVYSPFTVKEES